MTENKLVSFRAVLVAVFVLALALRLAYFNSARMGELGNPDSLAYEGLADAIRTGQPYATSHPAGPGGFPADLQRPPGYPFFLVLVNPSSGVSRVRTGLVQSILGAVFAVALAGLAGRIFTPVIGLLTGFLYAVDWVTVVFTPLIFAELVYTVVLTLAILLYGFYIRAQRTYLALAAGITLGIAALIKPAALVVLLAMLLAWLCQAKRHWAGLTVLITFAMCVTPWMIRNYWGHGLMTLSAINTTLLYFYTAQGAAANTSWREFIPTLNRLDYEWTQRELSPKERKQQMEAETWQLISQHWPTAVKQAALGFVRSCVGTGRETLGETVGGDRRPGWFLDTVVPLAQVLVMWILAVIGGVSAYRSRFVSHASVVLMAGSALLILAISAGPAGYARYRVPMVPELCLFAALGILQLWRGSPVSGRTALFANVSRT